MVKPTARLRRFMWGYTILWWVMLPVILSYLWLRGRKDPRYLSHLKERFGYYDKALPGSVWVHAVSLGETRSAAPLIKELLARGETVVTTHFTPTGRSEAERLFADAIAAGQLLPVWVPLEYSICFKRFYKCFKPKLALVMEIETWPRMILSAEKNGVPLFLCNAQYPRKSFDRDRTKSLWRMNLHRHVAGAFVKSDLQEERFKEAGVSDITVTGELRFDQPIPEHLVKAGTALKKAFGDRQIIALPSVVVGEDETYLTAIKALKERHNPLFTYIPRAPERFDETAQLLSDNGLSFARRSDVLNTNFEGEIPDNIDVFLGDSMGEMYAYLAMSDRAVIGGSFVEKGAHNISEPLALGLPCVVGPHTWTIEFPVVEALAAGVCMQVSDGGELVEVLASDLVGQREKALEFATAQMGGTQRTLKALENRGLISSK